MAEQNPNHLNPIIRFPRSTIEGAVPDPTKVEEGEINMNLQDRALYSKRGDQVVKVGGDYDDILEAHFNERNPHGTRPEDIGLTNVPNVDLRDRYFFDPDSRTFNESAARTIIEYLSTTSVTYQIESDQFAIGDVLEFNRLNRNGGRMTIRFLNNAQWIVDNAAQSSDIATSGRVRLGIQLRKVGDKLWTTRVYYV